MIDPRIEAAARALCGINGNDPDGNDSYVQSGMGANWRAYEDEARAALAAADVAAWRPIETAPANKEIVLGWESYSFTGFKDELFSESAEIGKFFSSKSGLKNGPLKRQPTHWQHLPAPPASIDALGGVDG